MPFNRRNQKQRRERRNKHNARTQPSPSLQIRSLILLMFHFVLVTTTVLISPIINLDLEFTRQCNFTFTVICPLAPRWRIGPPHVLSIDSCLALQCTPLSRTTTLLWTSPFLLCVARLFLAGLSFSFPLGSMSAL